MPYKYNIFTETFDYYETGTVDQDVGIGSSPTFDTPIVDALQYNALGSNMHTYIKSPFYRVSPPEYCRPTVFVRPILDVLLGIRGNHLKPRLTPSDLFFHHFTYVRKYEKDVFKKIWTTLEGDRDDVKQTELVDMDEWIAKKWNRLPRSRQARD